MPTSMVDSLNPSATTVALALASSEEFKSNEVPRPAVGDDAADRGMSNGSGSDAQKRLAVSVQRCPGVGSYQQRSVPQPAPLCASEQTAQ